MDERCAAAGACAGAPLAPSHAHSRGGTPQRESGLCRPLLRAQRTPAAHTRGEPRTRVPQQPRRWQSRIAEEKESRLLAR